MQSSTKLKSNKSISDLIDIFITDIDLTLYEDKDNLQLSVNLSTDKIIGWYLDGIILEYIC